MLFSSRLPAASELFEPILAPLVGERRATLLLVAIGILQVGLTAAGLPGWPCPVKTFLGIPCPGCGLSSALVWLLRGEWDNALRAHVFAPVFLLGFVLMVVVSVLPGDWHRKVVGEIARLERRTGIMAFLLLSLIAYWGLRLLWLL